MATIMLALVCILVGLFAAQCCILSLHRMWTYNLGAPGFVTAFMFGLVAVTMVTTGLAYMGVL